MTPETAETFFTRADGSYVFARWGRPIVPVAFGIEDETLAILKGAFEAVAQLAGHDMAETDPELGANIMCFFFRDWDELTETPNLDQLIPNLTDTVARLKASDASQYRAFRFDDHGAIQAAFVFVRMTGDMLKLPAETIALTQAVQTILLWSDTAFAETSPLAATEDGTALLKPEIADVIRAAYDPVMPASARDASHALRLAARLSAGADGT